MTTVNDFKRIVPVKVQKESEDGWGDDRRRKGFFEEVDV